MRNYRVIIISLLLGLLIGIPTFVRANAEKNGISVSSGRQVLNWHTFLGGSENDCSFRCDMAVDSQGNVYVTGESNTAWGSLPVNAYAGGKDVFVAKLNSEGVLQWHTFMGSSSNDFGSGIAVDEVGNVYIAGYSDANWGTSPINAYAGDFDAFIAKLDSNGVRQWHTFLGSVSGNDVGRDIAVDAMGNIYTVGYSNFEWGSPLNHHSGGVQDAFVAKLNSNGVRQWNTFLGSPGIDYGGKIATNDTNVYIAGESDAAWGISPLNPYVGAEDVFAAKLSSNGQLSWNTFLGSSGTDYLGGITFDGVGNLYISGQSDATWGTSPINAYSGGFDAFVAKLNSNSVRQWHTFLGSVSGNDVGRDIVVENEDGSLYVAGSSDITWGSPLNPHAGGSQDAVVGKLNNNGGLAWNTFIGSFGSDSGRSIAVDRIGNFYIVGNSDTTWGNPINAHAGSDDAFIVKSNIEGVSDTITPLSGGTVTTYDNSISLQFPSDAVTSTTTITITTFTTTTKSIEGFQLADRVFDVIATDINGNPVNKFIKPFTLTLTYNDADWQDVGIVNEADLNVYWWNGSVWMAMLPCNGCSHNTLSNQFIIILDHLTEFVLLGHSGEKKIYLPIIFKNS